MQHTVQEFTKYVAQRAAEAGAGDSDDDTDTTMLSSGAIVCKAHKLEVCGACELDFRGLNQEMGKTVPPPEKPVVSKKEVKATAKFGQGDVDPSKLKAWSQDEGKLERTFVNCFSMQEKMRTQVGDRPTDDVNYDMRESMVVIGKTLDSTSCKDVSIQDEAQSNALFITILKVLEWPQEDGTSVPLLLCRFQANNVAAPDFMAKMQHMAAAFKGSASIGGVKNIPTSRKEVEGFTKLLEQNHSALSAAWQAKQTSDLPPTFKLSFLSTIKALLPSAERVCICSQTHARYHCGRCGCVYYCSTKCQRADWKRHKPLCKAPQEKTALGEAVVVQMLAALPDDQSFLSTVSLNQPLTQAARKIQDTSQPAQARDGEVRVVKVQTPAERGERMLVYDKTKAIQTMIHPGNTSASGYNELFDLISAKGEAGGRKGYFNAAVMAQGAELHVYAKEMLGLQAW